MIKHNSACLLFTVTEFQPKIKKENNKKKKQQKHDPIATDNKVYTFHEHILYARNNGAHANIVAIR